MSAHNRHRETSSESMIPSLVAQLSDPFWVVSNRHELVFINTAATEFHRSFFGMDPVPGTPVLDAYPGTDRARWSELYERALAGERVYTLESRDQSGDELCYELVFEAVEAPDGNTVVVVEARDITERRRTTRATTFEARAVITGNTFVLSANPHFRTLIGLAGDTPIRSLKLIDLIEPDDQLHFRDAIRQATQTPARLDRLRIIDLGGRSRETVGTIARSEESGNFALALLDISRQIEAEVELERHAEHLRALHSWAAELNAYMERPDVLYRRSLELLSATVRFDTASVQILDDERLRIVECSGFPDREGLIGESFAFDTKFPNWHVITSRQIVAVDDVSVSYPHFRDEADEYHSGHIASWLGVPLCVRDEVVGMIALDRSQMNPFTPDEQRLVATMADHIAVAVHNAQLYGALQKSEERLQEANKQKEVLLRELHHRSKNNMQMISSLLSLGAAAVSLEEDGRVLDEVRMRIQSLAAVHEELYRSKSLDRVDLADYARRIVGMITSSYGRRGVRVAVDVTAVPVTIDTSVPFGLILSELMLNAYKHAFPDFSPGLISVELATDGDAGRLVVRDDGVGFTEEELRTAKDSLGMQLVESLVEQMSGSIELLPDTGTKWVVTFPLGPVTGRSAGISEKSRAT